MSAPVELLSGRLQGAAAWQAVGGGALWALLCGVGAAVVWRRGVAHHEAVGA
jgi:ABC-2 type transport system permease protein